MPKQIIGDVIGELLETGKKTGQQLGKLPGEIVEEAAQQTGIKPQTREEKAVEETKIAEMKKKDEEKKGKDIAFVKRQLAEFNQPPAPAPTIQERQVQEKKAEIMALGEGKKKELPPPVAAVKRKGRVEIKGGVGG